MDNETLALCLYVVKQMESNAFQRILESMDARKYVQKYIYLLKEMLNVSFSYKYNLYIYGPYSPSLAEDIFQLASRQALIDRYTKGYSLTEGAISDIDRFHKEIMEEKPEDLEDIDWLELLTTFHFLYTKTYKYKSDKNEKIEKCREYIKLYKNRFTEPFDSHLKVLLKLVDTH